MKRVYNLHLIHHRDRISADEEWNFNFMLRQQIFVYDDM